MVQLERGVVEICLRVPGPGPGGPTGATHLCCKKMQLSIWDDAGSIPTVELSIVPTWSHIYTQGRSPVA